MDLTGELDLTIQKYFPLVPCADSNSAAAAHDDYWEEGTRRRRTGAIEGQRAAAVKWPSAGDLTPLTGEAWLENRPSVATASPRTTPTVRGRRLATGGGDGGGLESADEGDVPKMEILDFAGLLLMWAVLSVWIVLWAYCVSTRMKQCIVRTATAGATDGEPSDDIVCTTWTEPRWLDWTWGGAYFLLSLSHMLTGSCIEELSSSFYCRFLNVR